MGWLLVMFDLPVTTKKERQLATKFRNDLLEHGYLMLQFSVYGRCAVTYDRKDRLLRDLEKLNPGTGHIRCVFITEAQWAETVIIQGPSKRSPRGFGENDPSEQLQFW